jgi:hypothetical protein
MRQQFPAAKSIAAAFGREHNGSFVCFDKSGKIVSVGGTLERSIFLRFSQAPYHRVKVRRCEIILQMSAT